MFRGLLFLSLVLSINNSFAEDNSEMITKLASVVTDMCSVPSTEGKYWKVEANGDAGASIKIFGEINGDIHLTNEEWSGIRNLRSEDQVDREKNYRACIQQVIPLFLEKMTKQEPVANGPRTCTQDQYDKTQYFAEKFADEYVNKKYDGG